MKEGSYIPAAIVLGSILISLSILISSGVIKVKGLTTSSSSSIATTAKTTPTTDLGDEPVKQAKVSVDDDPVLGDKDAPLTMIEFSDYECPFCKRHFAQTLPELKKNYVDTGKMKIVYRDLPLDFHQNAHKEAQAANCSRDQGGDSVYFKFHDEVFQRTTSNGTGLALDQLPVIAKDLGLNVSEFEQCLDSEKYKAEVDKDLADAANGGATGTPSFFIGKSSSNGTIDGTLLVGAQPLSAFTGVIEPLLQ